jgi:hypothetical protein
MMDLMMTRLEDVIERTRRPMTARERLSPLAIANLVLLAAMALHAADHVRQGTGSLTPEVFWGGAVLGVVALATLGLTLRDHPSAPLVAAVVGLWIAAGVSASHLAPHWSAFSDPYADIGVDAWSWAAALAEVGAALAFALIGIRELRRLRRSKRDPVLV